MGFFDDTFEDIYGETTLDKITNKLCCMISSYKNVDIQMSVIPLTKVNNIFDNQIKDKIILLYSYDDKTRKKSYEEEMLNDIIKVIELSKKIIVIEGSVNIHLLSELSKHDIFKTKKVKLHRNNLPKQQGNTIPYNLKDYYNNNILKDIDFVIDVDK